MKFSHINTREIHPAYRAVSLSGPARLPYKQALKPDLNDNDLEIFMARNPGHIFSYLHKNLHITLKYGFNCKQ
jgi:hypothetical protein